MATATADTHLDLSTADPHPDLAPTREGTVTGGKKGYVFILLFMLISILLSVLFVVLCFKAESTRPQLIREVTDNDRVNPEMLVDYSDCAYTSNRKKPLIYGVGAFLICFAVAEISLLIGLSVEVRHLKWWSSPRTNCDDGPMILFMMAALFGITSAMFATPVSTEALKTQWLLLLDQEKVPQEVELT
ncbi:uncharacterized protein [Rutidosis leptorrhynchoides]|uniref:uncharacterized protein n=1 Tax=Rutidosis leptorrhynchoides TaxID=125765 RepID=UPI003A9A2741